MPYPAASSAIRRVEYDEAARVLSVWFRGGRRAYRYGEVPPEAYEALLESASVGSFVNAEIKGRYPILP